MKLINFILLVFFFYTSVLTVGCKKTKTQPGPSNPPVVSTKPATSIGSTSVVSGGEFTNATNVTDKGIIWGTDSSTLIISNSNKISNGAGVSNFTDTVQNLQPNTTYYLRAYAVYNSGVVYGAALKCITLQPQPAVHIAGDGGCESLYWKNGKQYILPKGGFCSRAYSVFVSGNDVYVAGEEDYPGGANSRAVYWKNGNIVRLTDGTKAAIAKSIYVVGNDVYVAGYDYLNTGFPYAVAQYWKNGISLALTAGNPYNYGLAHSIYVVGSDVYVAGVISNQILGTSVATCWKNGIPVSLSDSARVIGEANSIFVQGSDVYVAGKEKPGLGIGGIPVAKYWKNGIGISLTDGFEFANANSIYVSGTDVYVAGYEYDGSTGNSAAKYWRNGTAISLTDGKRFGNALSVFVKGNDVYIVGGEGDNFEARFWKNGIQMPLEMTTTYPRAFSVFVE